MLPDPVAFVPLTDTRISRDCRLLAELRELTQSDALFYSLVCYELYVLCGPIFIGSIVDSHFGVVFVFGLFVSNTFLPESFTYVFEIYQLVFCVFTVLLPYGWFACLLSPGRLWLLPFAWVLFRLAGRRPK
ncbi:unnamed protein product [Dibothriocephalus latus]|uniref:TMEM62 C-terminal domain-containing protein n=1 Tax=Dibothriocephalus latus TaxID=60516 RepID=A0A3P7LAW6_DIBLA|nr:unnamed protein product [Dibothriocephalus latus]